MKNLLYLISLLVIVSSCKKKSDQGTPVPEAPVVPKSITRSDTYYELNIYEFSKWMDQGDTTIMVDIFALPDSVQSSSQNIETNWDSDLGIITFNSENPGSSPYPTVTITYDNSSGRSHIDSKEYEYEYDAKEVGISLQDVLVGTAAELNARTYIHPYLKIPPSLEVWVKEIGENYIEGVLSGYIYKRIFDQGRFKGEVIQAIVKCKFRVCTRC